MITLPSIYCCFPKVSLYISKPSFPNQHHLLEPDSLKHLNQKDRRRSNCCTTVWLDKHRRFPHRTNDHQSLLTLSLLYYNPFVEQCTILSSSSSLLLTWMSMNVASPDITRIPTDAADDVTWACWVGDDDQDGLTGLNTKLEVLFRENDTNFADNTWRG